jgi:hypothetical protein
LRDAEQVGVLGGGGGAKRFDRRRAKIDHDLELFRVLALGIDGGSVPALMLTPAVKLPRDLLRAFPVSAFSVQKGRSFDQQRI